MTANEWLGLEETWRAFYVLGIYSGISDAGGCSESLIAASNTTNPADRLLDRLSTCTKDMTNLELVAVG